MPDPRRVPLPAAGCFGLNDRARAKLLIKARAEADQAIAWIYDGLEIEERMAFRGDMTTAGLLKEILINTWVDGYVTRARSEKET